MALTGYFDVYYSLCTGEGRCLMQVLVVRRSIIQISDTGTMTLNYTEVFMGHFLYNLPRFIASMWHTQRMANFVMIFL